LWPFLAASYTCLHHTSCSA